MSKKPIRSSNLALRFYLKDGWKKEDLQACIGKFGSVELVDGASLQPDISYFRFSNPCDVNLDKLSEKCSQLHRMYNDYPDETDRAFMARHI